jgi:signal transduction histidine kinase
MALNLRSIYVNPAERDRRMAAALNETSPRPGEFRLRRKDGSTFPALIQNLIVRGEDGQPSHVEGFVTDVSEMKRLEAERQKAEQEQRISTRLQSVGALAAGIAHEINTPMQFVSDSVYFIKSAIDELGVFWPEMGRLSGPESAAAAARIQGAAADIGVDQLMLDADQSAERALEGIRRVTKIIRAMHEFAHPDSGEHTLVDINHAIETTLTVCRNVYKQVADVRTEFGDIPQVMCQYGEINQAILNIVVNAVHAIEARRSQLPRGLIRIGTRIEDEWAVIAIEDNGTGIPESVKARIFDPFFTTKEVGKGTGQGLAIVQSVIVGRHKGRISVDSEVGTGTTFVLRLPLNTEISQVSGDEHEAEDRNTLCG